MTRRFLLSLTAAAMSVGAFALPISPEQALKRMEAQVPTRGFSMTSATMKLSFTQETDTGAPSLYVFNRVDDNGFVILSADDDAYPMLGYVDNGKFDENNIPPALKWWLGEYSRQIEYARSNGGYEGGLNVNDTRAAVSGGAIEPMVKTKWNQGTPYNDQCPRVNGVRCVTGCVATAMAQVMKFHGYPEKGTGEVSIELQGTTDPTTLDLSAEAFDWNNMLDTYESGKYSSVQSDAVAYLMKACGYSVKMKYTTSESGAVSFNIGKALIENFGYNSAISFEERIYYNETSWNQMVYDELKAKRPVIYGGQSEGGGHQFVCDGYDGKGYFHINWGWGGVSDGYFLLQSLNPDDLGIGGGTGGGFSYDQSIIKGVQPKSEGVTLVKLVQSGNLTGNKSSTARMQLKLAGSGAGWWNMGYAEAHISLGVIIEGIEGTNVAKTGVAGTINDQSLENVNLASLRGFTSLDFLFPATYPDGKYKVTVAYRNLDTRGGDWEPVICPEYYSNSVTVTKAGTKYTLDFAAAKTLTIVSGEVVSPLYYGSYAKVKMEVKNDTDVELSQTIAPVLMKQGTNQFIGDGVPVNLKPGESIVKEFDTYFEAQKGVSAISAPTTFSLKFINLDSGETYKFSKSGVVMNPESSATITVSNLDIKGASKVSGWSVDAFSVADPSEMEFSADISCGSGFFSLPVYAVLFPNESGATSISITPLSPVLSLSAGETGTVSGTIYFDQAVEGKEYQIVLYKLTPNGLVSLKSVCVVIIPSSGVEEVADGNGFELCFDHASGYVKAISDSEIVSIRIVSMSGMVEELPLVGDGNGYSASAAHLAKGIYVVTATDKSGKSKSIKIAR